MTGTEYADCLAAFVGDCLILYHMIEVSDSVLELARELVGRQALRTLDALQLASALVANRLFVDLNLAPRLSFRLMQIC